MYWKLCHADLKEAIRRGDAAPETVRGEGGGWKIFFLLDLLEWRFCMFFCFFKIILEGYIQTKIESSRYDGFRPHVFFRFKHVWAVHLYPKNWQSL